MNRITELAAVSSAPSIAVRVWRSATAHSTDTDFGADIVTS
jgi:hypothetical protein